MRKPVLLLMILLPATLWALFQRPSPSDEVQQQWLHVLSLKRNWVDASRRQDPSAVSHRQLWADALTEFTKAYPEHERAAKAKEDLTVEFAQELYRQGRYSEAAGLYRSVLDRNGGRNDVRDALDRALSRMSVSKPDFDRVRQGMSPENVQTLIGLPADGWKKTMGSGDDTVEAWFYRRSGGGLAGVYFSHGKVFRTEFESSVAPNASRSERPSSKAF
ncbi:MAG: hypothetical protein ABI718_06020 [Acidobacteriota bacterium]